MNGKVLFLGSDDSPLIEWLEVNNHEVFATSEKVSLVFIKENNFDYLVSYGYRYILTKEIIEYFDNQGINLHISFLPWNKGADPNLWSFIENTKKGVTIHYLDEGVDTGDIIIQKEVEFDMESETLSTSYSKLQGEIQLLFKENWGFIKNGTCNREKQSGKGSCHKSKDKSKVDHLIKNGWNTLVVDLVSKI